MRFLNSVVTGLVCWVTISTPVMAEKPMGLQLPTENRYLFSNSPQKFYMYTYRSFDGESSKPWTAGKYGYVRTLRKTSEGVIATKFHEGIDIRPSKRDSAGRPLDLVKSIADGRIAHVNSSAGGSNYGRYIVVQHDWGSGEFYSIYAHLDKVHVSVGQPVSAGTVIAKMGYTGAGINRERAHLHLELNVMAQRGYGDWHAHYFGSKNRHGIHNGLNMNGLDVSEALIRSNTNKRLTITQFIDSIPTYFKVTVPRKGTLDIADRYPWIRKGNHDTDTPSWEISYAKTGFPLAVAPSMRRVSKPKISYVQPTKSDHRYHTKGLLSGKGSSATLSKLGLRTVALISGDFPRRPKVITPKLDPTAPPRAIPVE